MLSSILPAVLFSAAAALPSVPLEKPTERELGPGEAHAYTLRLARGEYVKVVAVQKGIDLVLTVTGPDGAKLAEVDSPNGASGPEPWAGEAPAEGIYRFELKSLDPAYPRGRYEVRVALRMPAEEYATCRIVDLDAARLDRYRGTFQAGPGRYLMVAPIGGIMMPGGKDMLLLNDTESRRIGPLYASSEADFFMGPTLGEAYPAESRVRFRFDAKGRAESLVFTPKGGAAVTCPRVDPFVFEEVTIPNGDVTLKGFLVRPEGDGPFPAVVQAHGSQATTARVGIVPNHFLRQGIAFLSFDKRGAGASTGSWKTSGMDDLAGDVLAGVAWLGKRKEIDPARIGIWGVSQGGWVGSLAASRSEAVKFLVIHSGSGVSVAENMVHEGASQMRDAGLDEPAVAEGSAFLRETLKMMTEGAAPETVAKASAAVAAKPWADFAALGMLPKEHYLWGWMRKNGAWDTAAALKSVRCPVLWFLGEYDTQVPVEVSAPRLREALAGNADATVKVIPAANHGLFEARNRRLSDVRESRHYAAGYWDTMASWLEKRVTKR